MTNKNENAEKIAAFIHQRLLKIELIAVTIVLIGFVLRINNIPAAGIIFTLALSTLSMAYFFTAFHVDNSATSAMELFANKLEGFALSTATIGLLFFLQNWPSSKSMILVSAPILTFIYIYSLVNTKKLKTIIRSAFFLILASCIYFIPKEKFQEWHIITDNLL